MRRPVHPLPPALYLHQGQVRPSPSLSRLAPHSPFFLLSPEVLSPSAESWGGGYCLQMLHWADAGLERPPVNCGCPVCPGLPALHGPTPNQVVMGWTLLSSSLRALPPLASQQMMTMTWRWRPWRETRSSTWSPRCGWSHSMDEWGLALRAGGTSRTWHTLRSLEL